MQQSRPNDLSAYWMPFTHNRDFKRDPRMILSAKGMYYQSDDGRDILDATAGLWCVNAGHARRRITEAVRMQLDELDYAPNLQFGHPKAFALANRLAGLLPARMNHVFFTNSGSESVDTALKIALAYQKARGKGSKTMLIGRERGYHGTNFGGLSVGGILKNRAAFGNRLAAVNHLRHTLDLGRNAFTKGQPEQGIELADDLERLVMLHDASSIAAVIVEPMAGSTGVLPPPKGYLERLRMLCDRHDILLIFDEVITAFGRLGTPTAAEYFGVTPDLMTLAKGLTNAVVPMGAVGVADFIYETLVEESEESGIELFHGYTYSGHPLAAAAGLATLELYAEEALFPRAAELAPFIEEAAHSLHDAPFVKDIRNLGLVAAIEVESREGAPATRAYDVMRACWARGVMVRCAGDTIAFSPPLIVSHEEIDRMFTVTREALESID